MVNRLITYPGRVVKTRILFSLIACIAFPTLAQPQTAPPTTPPVRLPGRTQTEIAATGKPVLIDAETVYVIDSDLELFILSPSKSLFNAVMRPGPVTIRAKFAGGTGKNEWKTFAGKFIYTIDAVGTGVTDIFVVPKGVTEESKIQTERLDLRTSLPPVLPPVTPVDPPPVIPPTPAVGYYFVVVRPDGPATPEFLRVMSDPAWKALTEAGHMTKDFTLTDANRIGASVPSGTTLPVVVTLSVSADGKQSTIVREAIPLPTNTAEIRKLPELKR